MDDIFVLEDNVDYQKIMRALIPGNLTLIMVSTVSEVGKYLSEGNRAKLYFLDDHVPRGQGESPAYYFTQVHNTLARKHPDAKIYYTGSAPSRKTTDYCEKRNISLINKRQIGMIISREISDLL